MKQVPVGSTILKNSAYFSTVSSPIFQSSQKDLYKSSFKKELISFGGIEYQLIVTTICSTGTTGALMLAAFFVDVIVWYKADKISSLTDFPENPPSMEIEELAPMSSAPQ